jgi:hypothetical protein
VCGEGERERDIIMEWLGKKTLSVTFGKHICNCLVSLVFKWGLKEKPYALLLAS